MPPSRSAIAALAEFRYQINKFLHFSEAAARAGGLEPQQHQLLLCLKAGPPGDTSVGYLAERLQIRHHSAVELIDRMTERGWVSRTTSPDDRRRVLVRLTRAGDAVLAQLSAVHMRELRQAGPALVVALEAVIPGRRRTSR